MQEFIGLFSFEREKEKKELIQQQKQELQEQVEETTADLYLNTLLEEIVDQLRESQDKLRELNQVKDNLFSVVSHDLRNPLATMQSFLRLITDHDEKLSGEERLKYSLKRSSHSTT